MHSEMRYAVCHHNEIPFCLFFNVCFCLRYRAEHVKEMHMFGGCVLACQVSMGRVQGAC